MHQQDGCVSTYKRGFFFGPGFPLGFGKPSAPSDNPRFAPGFGPGKLLRLISFAGGASLSASVAMLAGAVEGSAASCGGNGSTTCATGVGNGDGGDSTVVGLQIHGVGGKQARRPGAIRRMTILLGFVFEEALRPVEVGTLLVMVVDMAGACIWWSRG